MNIGHVAAIVVALLFGALITWPEAASRIWAGIIVAFVLFTAAMMPFALAGA